jgi:hypothetical protein
LNFSGGYFPPFTPTASNFNSATFAVFMATPFDKIALVHSRA